MSAFDANLLLGRLGWRPIGVESATDLLRAMDRFGIERGLVAHLMACIHEPETGNAALFRAVAGHEDRLLPTPVVDLGDGGRWLEDVPRWIERGVRALRLVPGFYGNSVTGEAAARLAAVAREHCWPVVVAVETVRATPWSSGQPSQARDFARRFPDVKVLMLGPTRAHWYQLPPALEAAPNLYLELSNIETGQSLEQLVDCGFGERLLHGSNHGMSYANVCLERINRSGLDAAVKERLLRGNAAAFLGEGPAAAP